MKGFYQQLLRVQDHEQLMALLDQHADLVTPEMAADLYKIFEDATRANQLEMALAATLVAAQVYVRLALPHEALKSMIDSYEIRFMVAQSADDYHVVRDDIYETAYAVMQVGDQECAFRSLVLAADCAYFAADASGSAFLEKAQLWLKLSLGDLIAASQWGSGVPGSFWQQRFANLIVALYDKAIYGSNLRKQPDTHLQLRQLAAAAEALIPADFEATYGLQESEIGARVKVIGEKTMTTTHYLANLSHKYGNKEIANARLDAIIERAGQSNELDLWVSLMFQRHVTWQNSEKTFPEVQQLLLGKAEQFRQQFRSRAGRIWSVHKLTSTLTALVKRFLGLVPLPEIGLSSRSSDDLVTASHVLLEFERLKARTLLDQLRVGMQEFADASLYQQCIALERHVLGFEPGETRRQFDREALLTSRLPAGDPLGYSFKDTSQKEEARKQGLSEIEAIYEQQHAGFHESALVVELAEITQVLCDDEALIEFFVVDDVMHYDLDIWIVVVTTKGARTIHIPLSKRLEWEGMLMGVISAGGKQPIESNPFQLAVVNLRMAIHERNEEDAHFYLKQFYEVLIAPLEEYGYHPQHFRHWIIVPHNILHYIPFVALVNGQGMYLIEQVALTIAPSASIWSTLQRQEAQPITSFLGIANPVFAPGGPGELPDTEDEVYKICKSLQPLICETYLKEEATIDMLQTHANGKSIIHIATHGDFPENDVIDFHRILLTPTDQHNGYLTAEDLRHMDFRATRLLVLNICNGGLYRLGPGDEPYGLIASSLVAGAENIISTLWPIDDEMGHYFMIEFYKHFLQMGPAEALRQAHLAFIQDQACLNDWASFLLIGTGRL